MGNDGAVHFPEEQLQSYLRVFLPEARLPSVLDEIAHTAIEEEVDDELALFAIAHQLMDTDERRTRDLEAAVLVAEVGLPAEEVARILDLPVQQVHVAVNLAWAESHGHHIGPAVTADQHPVGVAAAQEDASDGTAEKASTAADPRTPWQRVPGLVWLGGLAVAALVALALAVFSEAGAARLHAVGLDPLVAFLVVVGLIGGGTALVRGANAPLAEEAPPPIGTPTLGRVYSEDVAPSSGHGSATAAPPTGEPGTPSAR
ncbi:MAG TPA: hypothetical protein VMM13_18285 [Euzebya sp.]|nr:hypothetical protein [Euzebya sp.]